MINWTGIELGRRLVSEHNNKSYNGFDITEYQIVTRDEMLHTKITALVNCSPSQFCSQGCNLYCEYNFRTRSQK
jgi:hypothetical protein